MGEMHYVCTREEARELLKDRDRFWVSNCGCREDRGRCERSRMDVCLCFTEEIGGSGSDLHEVSREFVEELFREAVEKHLVTRPFRNPPDLVEVGGICFCCDDCCGYFLDESSVCDRGVFVEKTDMGVCTGCGACVEVCYFGARATENDALLLRHDDCYGCGLCLDVCPTGCIELVETPEKKSLFVSSPRGWTKRPWSG